MGGFHSSLWFGCIKAAAPKLLSLYTNGISGSDKELIKGLSVTFDSLSEIDPESAGRAYEFFLEQGPLGVQGAGYGWTTTVLPNGKDLIAGGIFYTKVPTPAHHVFSRAQLYDPNNGKRMETGAMNVERYEHTATLLKNGKVLVAGGEDAKNKKLLNAELYDPVTGKWTLTGSMNAPHCNNSAVMLSNGNVLVFSEGGNGSPIHNQELYDSTTGMWNMDTNYTHWPK